MRFTIASSIAALSSVTVLVVGFGVQPAGAVSREVRGSTQTSVSRSANRNVEADRNVNVNRNVNIHRDVNVDVDYHLDDDHHSHPVATAAAVAAAAAVTAAVVGSIVHSLPPACTAVLVNGVTYQNCGGAWYQPQYAGTTIQYVVVNPPR